MFIKIVEIILNRITYILTVTPTPSPFLSLFIFLCDCVHELLITLINGLYSYIREYEYY